jgi:hypothetical protein
MKYITEAEAVMDLVGKATAPGAHLAEMIPARELQILALVHV